MKLRPYVLFSESYSWNHARKLRRRFYTRDDSRRSWLLEGLGLMYEDASWWEAWRQDETPS